MPRPRFDKLPPERREHILEVSAREFGEHGFDGASLNHILGTAGVSKGAAYYYFDDKADLFATVVRHYWQHLITHVALAPEALDATSVWPTIQELSRLALTHFVEAPWTLSVAKSVWHLSKEAREQGARKELFGDAMDGLATLFTRGQALGLIRTDLPTDLLIAMVLGIDEATDRWMLEHYDQVGLEPTMTLAMKVLSAVQRLLAPEPAKEAP